MKRNYDAQELTSCLQHRLYAIIIIIITSHIQGMCLTTICAYVMHTLHHLFRLKLPVIHDKLLSS